MIETERPYVKMREVDNQDLSWFEHLLFGSTSPDVPPEDFAKIARKNPTMLFLPHSVLSGKKDIDQVNEDRKGIKKVTSFFGEEYPIDDFLRQNKSFPILVPGPLDESGMPQYIQIGKGLASDKIIGVSEPELTEFEEHVRPEIRELLGKPQLTEENLIQFPILRPGEDEHPLEDVS